MVTHGTGQSSNAIRYDQKIEIFDQSSHYGRLLQLVGREKTVLELGSSTGYLTDAMQTHFGCRVVGVEIDSEAASVSQSRGNHVLNLDLDISDLSEVLKGQKFDVVLCADVLEHLRHPEQVLRACSTLLNDDGMLVASIPNAAHADVRLALLGGQLPFRPMGLLDNTHIKFFTRALVEQLLEGAGFRVVSVSRNRWKATKSEVRPNLGLAYSWLSDFIRHDPEAETYQFILTCRKHRPSDSLKTLSNEEAEEFDPVDIVILQTGYQKADDIYQKALDLINYPPEKLRFWLAADSDLLALERPASNPPDFDSSDFRTFTFLPSGQSVTSFSSGCDVSLETREEGPSKPPDIAAVLTAIGQKSKAKYVFLLETSALPGTNCIYELVCTARSIAAVGRRLPLLAAKAELNSGWAPDSNSSGHLSWHEFSGLLIPRENLAEMSKFDSLLRTSLAQAQDMCFNAWVSGVGLEEVSHAVYFSNGSAGLSLDHSDRLRDGLHLRCKWGTRRNLLAYARFASKRIGAIPTLLQLLKVLYSVPHHLPRSNLAASEMIGFSGPSATQVGRITSQIDCL